MKKYILNTEEQWLQDLKIIQSNEYNYELEIRFTGITKEIYEIIFYEFFQKYKDLKIVKTNNIEKVIYNKNISYIQSENKYKIKKRLKWLYLKNINANITLSTEDIIYMGSNVETNHNMKIREKKRTSFVDIINNVSYDFTIIDNNLYQIEIELLNINSNITYSDINIINNSIYKILEILPLNIKKILNQPIPLKNKENILNNFAVTEKLDGLRSILYITDNGNVILLKNNFQTKFITNLKIKNYNNTIIDGELINNKIFYAFDIIIFKDIYLRENLIKRVEKLKTLKFLSKKGKMDIYYRVKKYYYDDIIENSKLILKNKKGYNIDGLIFNSINQDYENSIIYKWKYIITFDFMMKQINNNDNITWELYCYNGNNTYIIFPNINNYKVKSDKYLDIKYKDGIIIEFEYDENNNIFSPLRIRNDKIFPNYISVALDNWDCHMNKFSFQKQNKS